MDRCGRHFGTILNFLRDGSVPLPKSKRELQELLVEAKYYLVSQLVELVETELKRRDELEPICRVPLITSAKEEQLLIASTQKVRKHLEAWHSAFIFKHQPNYNNSSMGLSNKVPSSPGIQEKAGKYKKKCFPALEKFKEFDKFA